jgi:hypothetical protein
LAGASALAGAGGAAQAGTTAATAACADGDCTNEVRGAGQVVQNATQASQSVWKLDPLQRGQEIERMLGRSPQLTQNFPVIDRFENGIATSIKSIDQGAKSYQNIGQLTSTIKGYVTELANWQGFLGGEVPASRPMRSLRGSSYWLFPKAPLRRNLRHYSSCSNGPPLSESPSVSL